MIQQYQQTCINESNEQINKYTNGDINQFIQDGILKIPCGVKIIQKNEQNSELQFNVSEIIIPDSVVYIGQYAFDNFSNMKSINIPESVIEISSYAFSRCYNLTEITLPQSIQYIGDYAFSYSGLKSIVIPDSVLEIGINLFYFCQLLENVTLSNQLSTIQNSTFDQCLSLKNILIPDSIKYIQNYAFRDCISLESITLPQKLLQIKSYVFYNCQKLQSINLPETLEQLDYNTFSNCTSIQQISIPHQIKIIDYYLFHNCTNLQSVLIPQTVTKINDYAFYNCNQLKVVNLPINLEYIGNYAFYNCTTLRCVGLKNSQLTSVQIQPSSFNQTNFYQEQPVYISKTSVNYCTDNVIYKRCDNSNYIYRLNIPSTTQICIRNDLVYAYYYNTQKYYNISVESCPENYSYMLIGQTPNQCIKSCSSYNITVYYINSTTCSLIKPEKEEEEQYTKVKFMNKNLNLFIQNEVLTIPYGVEVIGMQIFTSQYKNSFTDIIFPQSLICIGQKAFSNCSKLKKIIIPDQIQLIDDEAFQHCQNLEQVKYNNLDILYNKIFYNCIKLQNVTGLQNVQIIGNYTFFNCQNLKYIDTTDKLIFINDYAFYSNINLNLIDISQVRKIGKYAFQRCYKFIYVQLPQTLTQLSDGSFSNCINLLQVDIPNTIKYIPENAFYSCKKLQTIILPESVESINSQAFYDCNDLYCIAIQNNNCGINQKAFQKTKFSENYKDYIGVNQCYYQPLGTCDDVQYLYIFDVMYDNYCMNGQNVDYFYVSDDNKNIIIEQCFGEYKYEYPSTPKQCVKECPKVDQFSFTQGKNCQSECNGDFAYPSNYQTDETKICNDSCNFYKMNNYKYCTEDCPPDYFYNNLIREQCLLDCRDPYYLYQIEDTCVAQCNGEYATPAQSENYVCDKHCTYYVLTNNNLQCTQDNNSCNINEGFLINLPGEQRDYCVKTCEGQQLYKYTQGQQCVTQCQNETISYQNICYKQCPQEQYVYENETCYDICPQETAKSTYGYVCDNQCQYYEINEQKLCIDNCEQEQLYHVADNNRDYCVQNCSQVQDKNYSQKYECVSECTIQYAYPKEGNICDENCQYYEKIINKNKTSKHCISLCNEEYPYQVNQERKYCVQDCSDTQFNYIYQQDKECVKQCYGEYAKPQYANQSLICSNSCQYYQQNNYKYCIDNCSGQYPYIINSTRSYCVQNCESTEFTKYYQSYYCSEKCTEEYAYNFVDDENNTICNQFCDYYEINKYKYCIQDCLTKFDYQIKIDQRYKCTQNCEQYQKYYIQNNTCVDECKDGYAYPNDNTNICNNQCNFYQEQKINYCINECVAPYQYFIKNKRKQCLQSCVSPYYYIQEYECKTKCTGEYAIPQTGNICDNQCLYQIQYVNSEKQNRCTNDCLSGWYLINDSKRQYCVYNCSSQEEYNIKYVDEQYNLYCVNDCGRGYKVENEQCVQKTVSTGTKIIIAFVCIAAIFIISEILIYCCYVKKRIKKQKQNKNMIAMT